MPNDDSGHLKAILDGATIRSYARYVSNDFAAEKEQKELGRELEKQVLDKFVDHIAKKRYTLGTVPQEKNDWAREQLFSGNVMGIMRGEESKVEGRKSSKGRKKSKPNDGQMDLL